MTPEETALIVRYIKSLCPQQTIDDYTYETWHDVIGHLEFDAARNAVISVKWRKAFVDPSDIIAEIERKNHAHPSERTAAEAIAASSVRELDAAPVVPPTPEYLAAKAEMDARMRQRAEQAMLTDREAERRANDWLRYKLSGKLPPELPELGSPPPPRWAPLPGDPPELRAWLARQAQPDMAGTL